MALSNCFGGSSWATPGPARGWSLARLLGAALVTMLWVVRGFLTQDYNFVGNNADMAAEWIPKFRFLRAWMDSGLTPWWDSDFLLGSPNLYGVLNPYSVLSQAQMFLDSFDKGLDYSLAGLSLLCGVSSVWFLNRLGFSPISALLGGLMFTSSGTIVTQLYSGHLGLYCSFCLTPLLLGLTREGLHNSRLLWCLPAALAVAALICSGSLQGTYIGLWLNTVFFLAQACLGSPQPVLAPTIWTITAATGRPGLLVAKVSGQEKFRDLGFTVVKLAAIYVLGSLLASHFWQPQVLGGGITELNHRGSEIFVHSAPPLAWLTLWIPHIFLGSGNVYNWTGWAHWEGQPGLTSSTFPLILLGMLGKKRRDLVLPLLIVLLGTLLGAGAATPAFSLYSKLDALIGHFEVPSRMFFIANFGLALLAAYGMESLIRCDWQPQGFCRRIFIRLSWITAALWLLSYYIDGSQAFWQEFMAYVQRGFNYRTETLVDPAEYYVLLWSRFSAVCALWLAISYALLRSPLSFRRVALPLLVIMDIVRFNLPFINLRPTTEFLAPAPLVALIEEKKLEGKVCNTLDAAWNGSFGLRLRRAEFNSFLADRQEDLSTMLAVAARIAPGFRRDLPSPLQRSLGVRLYVHPNNYLEDESIRNLFIGASSFRVQDQAWQLTCDSRAREEVYLSRAAAIAISQTGYLKALEREPKVLQDNLNFLDPASYRLLLADLSKPERQNQPKYPPNLQDRLAMTQNLPTSTKIECLLTSPAMVILNQAWHPDWKVYVDGVESNCFPCQMGLNRGVLVNAGPHTLEFSFLPQGLLEARRASWLTLVGCALYTLSIVGFTFLYKQLFR